MPKVFTGARAIHRQSLSIGFKASQYLKAALKQDRFPKAQSGRWNIKAVPLLLSVPLSSGSTDPVQGTQALCQFVSRIRLNRGNMLSLYMTDLLSQFPSRNSEFPSTLAVASSIGCYMSGSIWVCSPI
ncbi:predicted protein [Histoplasma capsulatum G186AR]|uniref:Uncharacterized protein n=1 Tax=Ajellomyces capsulatus (strain G186AR / H82 / ATCC MYA-2454 / RMSCC 2432) TaxID=447093 RepID=C0NT41_AJECG|nr:uncharacterized protein HCBG_06321 [Histoplasma capsulatum G186AR]EEH05202.1 predicted protein [Histoplasma capsulatum G186AR]